MQENEENDETLVCYCKRVDKRTIIAAIKDGNNSLAEIKKTTKACTGDSCRETNPSGLCCARDIRGLLEKYSNTQQESTHSCC